MTRDTTILADIRSERGPLAALAVAALLVRVLLGTLGFALMPGEAVATPFICSGSGTVSAPAKSIPAHGGECPCGHVCPHAGANTADAGPDGARIDRPAAQAASRLAPPAQSPLHLAALGRGLSIRAPPQG